MDEEIKQLTEEIRQWRAGQNEMIAAMRKLLLGNGGVGLCETVREISRQTKALWTLVSIIGVAIITGVVKLLFFT